jgi:NTP pyrophosphatase (non-canonical NTP hydrolase)
MFNYAAYEKAVEALAQYPYANAGNLGSILYPTLGLTGEVSEVLEKIADLHKGQGGQQEIVKELGDVLWYITRCAAELSVDLKTLTFQLSVAALQQKTNPLATTIFLSVAAGRVAEHVKKALRDDEGDLHSRLTESRRAAILEALRETFLHLICTSLALDSSLEEVAVANIAKLTSRKERNLINGEGDNR